MPADDGDSGIEAMSLPESRETSPKMSKRDLDVAMPTTSSTTEGSASVVGDEDDLDLDETLYERLWGLTEMFPPKAAPGGVRRGQLLVGFGQGPVQLRPLGLLDHLLLVGDPLCTRHLRAGATANGGDEQATTAPDSAGSKCSCVWWCTTWHDASNGSWTTTTEVKSRR
ncbi:hypothetical protein MRX96_035807 [Rhipicephalus microplus]